MFQKVEINIPLLDALKQIPKYAKFLKELFVHKRKKMKGNVEVGGIVSAMTRNKDFIVEAPQALPKKCRDPKIFSIPCTIGDCTFANAMLDLGASIHFMPTSIYKSLNFGDLEPTRMTIQLANRSVVQPLGILEDVLVQVNELIFPADFYVLDMEDETSGKGSTLTWGNIRRQHKKAIGWKVSNLPRINPSICMHRILMEEEARPIRQQQRRMNSTILHMVKKEVTKLLATRIIYPISDSQWVSLAQQVPKKSRMTVMKNHQDELVPMWIQNSWRYRRLNQATRKDHFPLPYIDQVLEKLARKSHYCFLDGLSRYMQIHIVLEDQHKTTFTCPFGTFAYTRMPFGLCNAPSTFQHCMTSIFSDMLHDCMVVFMDDFTVYVDSFDACLENLSKVLMRCINTNLVLNFEKFHFMVTEGIVLGHLVSNRGIEVDKSKIDIITSLPNPASMRGGFYKRFINNFNKIALPLSKLLQKDVEFNFDQPCIEAFQELKNRLTSTPILQAPN
ncbi:Retrovirus-related Pol polyprotein, partial [Mucuna pruriens]